MSTSASACCCSDPYCTINGCRNQTGCPDWTRPFAPTYPQPYYPPVYPTFPTFPQPPAVQPVGWKCPNCGAGVSPDIDICSNCRPIYPITTIYTTTSTTEANTNDREDNTSDS